MSSCHCPSKAASQEDGGGKAPAQDSREVDPRALEARGQEAASDPPGSTQGDGGPDVSVSKTGGAGTHLLAHLHLPRFLQPSKRKVSPSLTSKNRAT